MGEILNGAAGKDVEVILVLFENFSGKLLYRFSGSIVTQDKA